MKRKSLFLILMAFSFVVFAKGEKENAPRPVIDPKTRIVVAVPTMDEVVFSDGGKMMAASIRERFSDSFDDVTKFKILPLTKSKMKKLRLRSEGGLYGADEIVEIGKVVPAKYVVMISLGRDESGYLLNGAVADILTGDVVVSAATKSRYTVDSVAHGKRSASDELAMRLCDELKVNLSQAQRRSLWTERFNINIHYSLEQQRDEGFVPERNIYMQKTEVTQKQYEKLMHRNPSADKSKKSPVDSVSWYNAVKYCNRLSLSQGLEKAYIIYGNTVIWNEDADGYRLPTEEEWEAAARGGEDFVYSGSDNAGEVAWCGRNSMCVTHNVASKKPNGYDLFDMTGNVSEWCWDAFNGKSSKRAVRGGNYTRADKITERKSRRPGYKDDGIGFRVCRNAG